MQLTNVYFKRNPFMNMEAKSNRDDLSELKLAIKEKCQNNQNADTIFLKSKVIQIETNLIAKLDDISMNNAQ